MIRKGGQAPEAIRHVVDTFIVRYGVLGRAALVVGEMAVQGDEACIWVEDLSVCGTVRAFSMHYYNL